MEKLNYYINKKIVYVTVKRTTNKNMYLKVKGKDIVVSANNGTSISEINSFVSEHINKFVKYINNLKKAELYSVQEKFIWFWGKKYNFSVLTGFKKSNFIIKEGKAYVESKFGEDQEIEKIIKDFLKISLLNYIKKISPKFEKIMNVPHHDIKVIYKTRTWGSNNIIKRSISYSSRLAHYNQDVINSVIVHELAHYYEPNHQKPFWDLVEKTMPNYKVFRKQLREDETMNEE